MTIPRVLLRYFGPALFLLMPIFVMCPQFTDERQRKTEGQAVLLVAFVTAALFRGVITVYTDHTTLRWSSSLLETLENVYNLSQDSWQAYLFQVLAAGCLCGITVLLYFLSTGKKKNAVKPFLVYLLILMIGNNVYTHYSFKNDYTVDIEAWDSVCRINDAFEGKAENILYLAEDYDQIRNSLPWDSNFEQVEYTYFYIDHDFYFYHSIFDETEVPDQSYLLTGSTVDAKVSEFSFSGYFDYGYASQTDHIDYIVIPHTSELTQVDEDYFEPVADLSDEYYRVYRNKYPEYLYLSHIRTEEYNEKE